MVTASSRITDKEYVRMGFLLFNTMRCSNLRPHFHTESRLPSDPFYKRGTIGERRGWRREVWLIDLASKAQLGFRSKTCVSSFP